MFILLIPSLFLKKYNLSFYSFKGFYIYVKNFDIGSWSYIIGTAMCIVLTINSICFNICCNRESAWSDDIYLVLIQSLYYSIFLVIVLIVISCLSVLSTLYFIDPLVYGCFSKASFCALFLSLLHFVIFVYSSFYCEDCSSFTDSVWHFTLYYNCLVVVILLLFSLTPLCVWDWLCGFVAYFYIIIWPPTIFFFPLYNLSEEFSIFLYVSIIALSVYCFFKFDSSELEIRKIINPSTLLPTTIVAFNFWGFLVGFSVGLAAFRDNFFQVRG